MLALANANQCDLASKYREGVASRIKVKVSRKVESAAQELQAHSRGNRFAHHTPRGWGVATREPTIMATTATTDDRTIADLVASAPPLSEAVRTTIAALFKAGA